MAEQLFTTVLRQILVTGVFHSDLHPGNIVLTDDTTLALLDFGSVGRLDLADRTSLSVLLAAVDRHDAIAATDALTDLLGAPDDIDQRGLERDIGQLIMKYFGGTAAGGSSQLLVELFAVVIRFGLSVPAPGGRRVPGTRRTGRIPEPDRRGHRPGDDRPLLCASHRDRAVRC